MVPFSHRYVCIEESPCFVLVLSVTEEGCLVLPKRLAIFNNFLTRLDS